MRRAFIETLSELARKDPKVILMVGDVGFSFIEDFAEEFPDQFINCGVTEQTMMGMAAGLALSGWKPYVYSMINFVTMRCYEQLRNDVCYNKANVKIIGVKGSEHYKFLGFSHNMDGDEDIDILGGLPNLGITLPVSPEQLQRELRRNYKSKMPMYFRI